MLDSNKIYHHKNQIIYDCQGNTIVKIKDRFPDLENISGNHITNINNYIKKFPDRVEIVNMKRQEIQLTLF